MSASSESRPPDAPLRRVGRRIAITLGAVGLVGWGAVQAEPREITVAHVPARLPEQSDRPSVEDALDEELDTELETEAGFEVPSRVDDPPIAHATPLPADVDLLARAKLNADGALVIGEGEEARTLTIVPDLQDALTRILQRYETPFAAVVAIEPSTGRVLAMAEHSEARPRMRGLGVKAIFPAASVFKIITAAALLDAGLEPDDVACSQGGLRRVTLKHLTDRKGDRECHSLSSALAYSANAVFAKLTARHLTAEQLLGAAERFGFNRPLEFPIPVEPSLIAVPDDPLGLAATGAGFGDAFLSPLHGAALAAVAANGGVWRAPILFEEQVPSPPGEQVVSAEHAAQLTEMMSGTVTRGTARRIFRERGYRVPGAVGKTGSLADKRPFRDYSWFVGFAPKDDPKIAVAAVIVNEPKWRIRATWLGREALRLGLDALQPAD